MSERYIVGFSGGAGSYIAAKRAIERHGISKTLLLFYDTHTEDEDLYRFVHESSEQLKAELVTISDGRNIWELFRDKRLLGNNRMPVCSIKLKVEVADRWWKENADADSVSVLGIDAMERHRADRLRKLLPQRHFWFPLLDPPYLTKRGMIAQISSDGIKPPRLYALGAPHNNCGGGCVRAGHAHFRWMLNALPCAYAEWERNEQMMRDFLGKDVSILKDRRGGTASTLTLRQLRESLEASPSLFADAEWGGCGCFSDDYLDAEKEVKGE